MVQHEAEFQRIRKTILERDNHLCQFCGAEAKEVHHLDGNRANNDPANLVASCRKCNQRRRKVKPKYDCTNRLGSPKTTTEEGKKIYMCEYMRLRRKGILLKALPKITLPTTTKDGKSLYMKRYIQEYRAKFEELKEKNLHE